jgi:hypothetical protein
MLDGLPLPLLALLLLAAMIGAHASGYALWSHFAKSREASGPATQDESYILSGVFGLLALLIAFSFSLAIGRFEDRRQLAIDEANAIGTMASRLALVEDDSRQAMLTGLANYAAARVTAGRQIADSDWSEQAIRAERLGDAFATRVLAYVRDRPTVLHGPLLVNAINTMNDTATARRAARAARLPGEVLALLVAFCLVAAATLGYALAPTGRRHLFASTVLFVLLSASFGTILDLDRPRGGAIVVPQDELEAAARKLGG